MQGRWGLAQSLRTGGDASWRMWGQRRGRKRADSCWTSGIPESPGALEDGGVGGGAVCAHALCFLCHSPRASSVSSRRAHHQSQVQVGIKPRSQPAWGRVPQGPVPPGVVQGHCMLTPSVAGGWEPLRGRSCPFYHCNTQHRALCKVHWPITGIQNATSGTGQIKSSCPLSTPTWEPEIPTWMCHFTPFLQTHMTAFPTRTATLSVEPPLDPPVLWPARQVWRLPE